jgi:ankyrin repeat protein
LKNQCKIIRDKDLKNPLDYAIRNNDKEVARLLCTTGFDSMADLNFTDLKIGDEDSKYFGETLKYNPSLTDLNLQNNKIGDEGAKSLAEALKHNTTLTTINFHSMCFVDVNLPHPPLNQYRE